MTEIDGLTKNNILVIIPAYNEGLVLGSLLLRVRQYAEKIIVVDDGSTDNTAEISRLANVETISLNKNSGKSNAMKVGFARAKEIGLKATVMIDGDGQHDPSEIPKIAEPILSDSADLVIGSRFINNDEADEIPAYRKIGQKILNEATNVSSGIKCSDSQSGYRALSRKALDNLDFESSGYGIESDMISHFAEKGLLITEVPISVTYDVPHKHKMNPIKHGLSVLSGLLQLISFRRPLFCFGIPGLILTIVGASLAFQAISTASISGWPPTVTLVSIMFLMMGMLLISVSLILYSISSLIRRKQ
ncbi:MAG: glycosyltransferase family 2 protein [Methanocorpusculum sp.]|nr:glycosyltransferase family 2 protein [Methanocorpusculum sp.]